MGKLLAVFLIVLCISCEITQGTLLKKKSPAQSNGAASPQAAQHEAIPLAQVTAQNPAAASPQELAPALPETQDSPRRSSTPSNNHNFTILSAHESKSYIENEMKNQPIESALPSSFQSPPKALLECLRVVKVPYKNKQGQVQYGEMIVNKDMASALGETFKELLNVDGFYIQNIGKMSQFKWSDRESMSHNNTSCWNYRCVSGSSNLSWHALGLAIDINPVSNPYVTRSGRSSPSNSTGYRPLNGSSTSGDPMSVNNEVIQIFKRRGFKWGGDWSSAKDYQHFEFLPRGHSSSSSLKLNKFCNFDY